MKRRRLYSEIKRIKEQLSISKELGFYVEDFFDDSSFSTKLSKDEFE